MSCCSFLWRSLHILNNHLQFSWMISSCHPTFFVHFSISQASPSPESLHLALEKAASLHNRSSTRLLLSRNALAPKPGVLCAWAASGDAQMVTEMLRARAEIDGKREDGATVSWENLLTDLLNNSMII